MKSKYFEKTLPENYKQILHVNAKDKKLGLALNAAALIIMAVVILIALIPAFMGNISIPPLSENLMLFYFAFALFLSLGSYMVLHELVHGAAYKSLTGEKLTFGISWSCAFCGVPNVYTYRKTAIISLISPLVLFSLILIPLTIALYFIHPLAYLVSAIVLASHLGGCSGDAYVFWLFLTKFKSPAILMRDTGPEQFFYAPEQNN